MSRVSLLNTHVNNLTMKETVEQIGGFISAKCVSYVVPINVDVVIKMEQDVELREIVDVADLVLADGKPLIWISKLNRKPIREKVSGSDLIPELFSYAEEKGFSIFLLGGEKDVAQEAGRRLKMQFPRLKLKGLYSPPIGFDRDDVELAHIDQLIFEAMPDILVVCLGCPKQEKWVAAHYRTCGAIVSICAGATVDFLAGRVKRAPRWMSDHGLEWLYRFSQEPKRLFQRYFIEDVKIVKLVKKYCGGEVATQCSWFCYACWVVLDQTSLAKVCMTVACAAHRGNEALCL